MSTNVLCDRDTNAQMARSPTSDAQKPKSLEYHRAMLESRVKEGKYVLPSPSPLSLSPAAKTASKPAGDERLVNGHVEHHSSGSDSCTRLDERSPTKPTNDTAVDTQSCTSMNCAVVYPDGCVETDVIECMHSHKPITTLQGSSQANMVHPRVLVNRMQGTYISPSDTIMSPATAKLAAFKNKHMGKGMKGQTLFAKTVSSNAANSASRGSSMFGEVAQHKKTNGAEI